MSNELNFDDLLNLEQSNFENTFYGNRKIILYGAGGVTESLLLNAEKIDNLLCICDRKAPKDAISDFMGYPYIQFEKALEIYSDFYVAISSLKYYDEIKKDLIKFIPDSKILPYTNWETRVHFNMNKSTYKKWLLSNEYKIKKIYSNLGDEVSKESFVAFLMGVENVTADKWLNISYLSMNCLADFFPREYFSFNDQTIYLDCGACEGDTVFDFVRASDNQFKKILAYEPDTDVFTIMQKEVENLGDERILCYEKAVGSKDGKIGFSKAEKILLEAINHKYLTLFLQMKTL